MLHSDLVLMVSIACSNSSLINYHSVSVINKIAQQELHDGQSENRQTETNENPNKFQVILPYSGKHGMKQCSTNCLHGDKHACNVHANRFLHARNCVHINQSKHF